MFGGYVDFIERNMDVAALKRNVISDNVANYNTPDFKATKVSFDHLFEQSGALSLKQSQTKHLNSLGNHTEPVLYQDAQTKERVDGNNVDLNVEMLDMIKNNSYYNKAVQAINKEFFLLKTAIGK